MFLLFEWLWIIFNGAITVEIILIGLVISTMLFVFLCKFMNYSIEKEWNLLRIAPLFLHYVGYLLYEITVANLHTIRMITTSKYEIEPAIIQFDVSLKSNVAKVILANSITLTPGTITVALEGQTLTVHALDRDFLEGIKHCHFIELLERMEEKRS